jgi:hypothetical protein
MMEQFWGTNVRLVFGTLETVVRGVVLCVF